MEVMERKSERREGTTAEEDPAMQLRSVEWLRRAGLEDFVRRFNLLATRHTTQPSLVLLRYNQVRGHDRHEGQGGVT